MDDSFGAFRNVVFVGDDDNGHAFPVHLFENFHHFLRGFGVEGAGGFVGEDDFGVADECPGDSYPLLLSARHLVGQVVGPVLQPDPVEVFDGEVEAFFAIHFLVVEREGDVFGCIFKRKQIERLKDEAKEAVAVFGGLRFADVFDQMTIEPVLANVVFVEDAEDVEQGRFAGAGGTHDRHHFTLFDGEVNAFEYFQAGVLGSVGFADVPEFDHKAG